MVVAVIDVAADCDDSGELAPAASVSATTVAPDADLIVTGPPADGMSVVLDYSPTISDIGALFAA